ncbi:MAG: PepSY-like domain-containing protein [Lewinellaceae bacterium]|nr:PepSY-like domain-containing protein [Phaeodactylibacter sp.]MCB9040452.1 PepSY-like domain-containing protein [Lewinellaceae bacterium]
MIKFSFGALLLSGFLFLAACSLEENFGFNPSDGPIGANPSGIYNPCETGVNINPDELPVEIQDYLSANYPGFRYKLIQEFSESGEIRYGIVIRHEGNRIEFYFEADGTLINSGPSQSSQSVNIDSLPALVLDHIEANYPDTPIVEAEIDREFGMSFFKVELADGTALYFSEAGDFLCSSIDGDDDGNGDDNGNGDDDDDDDDDGGNGNGDDDDDDDGDDDDDSPNGSLSSIYTYIQDNYSGSSVDDIEFERLCGGPLAFEVQLEGEDVRLYFDMGGNFLFSATSIAEQDLPQAVTDAISSEYPDYQIANNGVKEFLFEDGSKQYQVKLRPSGNNDDDDIKVIFSEGGDIVCSED